ncbi:hypothetical protein BYT27DRAFT_7208844 [Phlegmacium glaucopus]|nr:hypothetical protein BYT27DRAFT_7208844 [Phlegmacium glaucopus]
MEVWSCQNILARLGGKCNFFPSSYRLEGKRLKPNSIWAGYLEQNGYIGRYWEILETYKDDANILQMLHEGMDKVFEQVQCLPKGNTPSNLWHGMAVSATARKLAPGPQRPQVSKAELQRRLDPSNSASKKRKRSLKKNQSTKKKNYRQPPKKQQRMIQPTSTQKSTQQAESEEGKNSSSDATDSDGHTTNTSGSTDSSSDSYTEYCTFTYPMESIGAMRVVQARVYKQKKGKESREDVEMVKPKGIKELDRFLQSTSQQELYASNHEDLIESSEIACRLHDYDIIILQDGLLDHPPIVTYFTRFFWNYSNFCIQGKQTQCGLESCTSLWNPDAEEQRFCWQCDTWFHTKCLIPDDTPTQAQHMKHLFLEFPEVPRSIIEVAYQPTARGGSVHYISGNIRLVNLARQLMEQEKREDILAKPDLWMALNVVEHQEKDEATLWWQYSIYENNIIEEKKGTEQLVVRDQIVYTCPLCSSFT